MYTLQLELPIYPLNICFSFSDIFHAMKLLTNIKSSIPRNHFCTIFESTFLCEWPTNLLIKINKINISHVFIIFLECVWIHKWDLFTLTLLHCCTNTHQWNSFLNNTKYDIVVYPLSKENPIDWVVISLCVLPVAEFDKFKTFNPNPSNLCKLYYKPVFYTLSLAWQTILVLNVGCPCTTL